MSQESEILKHLINGGRLTPLEALHKFGCMRLGARIWDIQRNYPDVKIESRIINQNGKHYSEYFIKEFPLFINKKGELI